MRAPRGRKIKGGKGGGCALFLFFVGLALLASAGGAALALRGGL